MIAAFHTLGCKTNAYETQAIQEQFQAAGYEIGNFQEAADVYIINTCAVTQEAARKSRQMTGRCKRNNPEAIVVVTGCYAQDASEKIIEECLADIVVGNSEKSKILQLVSEMMDTKESDESSCCVKDLTRCTEYEDQTISNQGDHVRAYVKIQDGCNRFCSYCLIPFMRGRSRSRKMEDIMAEVRTLAAGGYKEIVLTGIDISSFDAGNGVEEDISSLIENIGAVEGIERIRLGSLEVGIVTDKVIERVSKVKAFCPQFHLSLQSGCDTVLERMNRHYNTAEYAESVKLIRKYYPEAAITTDVIAGFPGETEEEFEITINYIKEIKFSRIHAFPYSRREKTRADKMPGQLVKALKEERAKAIIEEAEILRKEYEEAFIGRSLKVLVEEVIKNPSEGKEGLYYAGYTPEYVRILIRSDENDQVNKVLEVIPTSFENGTLWAE